jgi:hypothetical protein
MPSSDDAGCGGVSESESVGSDTVVVKRRRIRKGKNAIINQGGGADSDEGERPLQSERGGQKDASLSSSSSSSSVGEDESIRSDEDGSSSDLSEREIARRERQAEKKRRKDPVRRRYVSEAASDEDDDDEGSDSCTGSESDCDSACASGRDQDPAASLGKKKARGGRKQHLDEDLSHASLFASIREFEAMQVDGSMDDEDSDAGSSGQASKKSDDDNGNEEEEDDVDEEEDDALGGASNCDASDSHGGENSDEGSRERGEGRASECSSPRSNGSNDHERIREQEKRERIRMRQILQDPDCCHNMSKSLRIVPGLDVQVDPRYDGYVYFFTSEMEGAALPQDTLKQVLVLLHVIHSFIPEECILETEYLKPTFDKQGGLEKLQRRVELTEEEARREEELRHKLSSLPISEMPFDVPFVASTGGPVDLDDDNDVAGGSSAAGLFAEGGESSGRASSGVLEGLQKSLMLKKQFRMDIVDVAEILLAPVFITYTSPEDGSSRQRRHDADDLIEPTAASEYEQATAQPVKKGSSCSERKVAAFMLTMLKTRKCYNFSAHLQWLVNSVDKEVGCPMIYFPNSLQHVSFAMYTGFIFQILFSMYHLPCTMTYTL